MNDNKNISDLAILQAKHKALEERMKSIDSNSKEFQDAQAVATSLSKQIDEIMKLIDSHNKKLSSMLNKAQEHVIGEFINPAITFNI